MVVSNPASATLLISDNAINRNARNAIQVDGDGDVNLQILGNTIEEIGLGTAFGSNPGIYLQPGGMSFWKTEVGGNQFRNNIVGDFLALTAGGTICVQLHDN